MRKLAAISILLCIITGLQAQDLHFSQFRESPLNLNPAMTGFFEGKMRATLNHRNQWLSIPVPYTTYSASLDAQVFKRKHKRDVFGIGVNVNNDVAGDSRFATSAASLSMAYMFSLNYQGNNIISLGASAGFVQRSIDYTKLVFDNQYNGSTFNPNLDPGEIFLTTGFTYLDYAVGANWFYHYSPDINFSAGASWFHINRPEQSLLEDKTILLDRKVIGYVASSFRLTSRYDLEPAVMYARQGTYTNLIFGARVKEERNSNPVDYSAITYGLFFRNRDALIINVNWLFRQYMVGISYDLNTSSLAHASNLRGGYEVSFSYILNPRKRNAIKPIPCPIF